MSQETKSYKVEHNPKIGKGQIKLANVNVAVAEFYENTTSSQNEIEQILATHCQLKNSLREMIELAETYFDNMSLMKRFEKGREDVKFARIPRVQNARSLLGDITI